MRADGAGLMQPLPDRTVILGLLITLGLVFALVFWTARLSGPQQPPLQWREPLPPALNDGQAPKGTVL